MQDDTKNVGVKKDTGKVRFSLIPIEPLWALAKLYTIGAKKYSPWNWANGLDWTRVYDAMDRHGKKWANRQKFDVIDGQHHLIAVAWCAFALYVYELFGIGKDDRPEYNLERPSADRMDPALNGLYNGEEQSDTPKMTTAPEIDDLQPEPITELMRGGLTSEDVVDHGEVEDFKPKSFEVTKVEA